MRKYLKNYLMPAIALVLIVPLVLVFSACSSGVAETRYKMSAITIGEGADAITYEITPDALLKIVKNMFMVEENTAFSEPAGEEDSGDEPGELDEPGKSNGSSLNFFGILFSDDDVAEDIFSGVIDMINIVQRGNNVAIAINIGSFLNTLWDTLDKNLASINELIENENSELGEDEEQMQTFNKVEDFIDFLGDTLGLGINLSSIYGLIPAIELSIGFQAKINGNKVSLLNTRGDAITALDDVLSITKVNKKIFFAVDVQGMPITIEFSKI